MIRKIILALLGIGLIAGAVFLNKKMMATKKALKPKTEKVWTTVFTEQVVNGETPINITTSGNLMAKNRVEIFSEVQGIFEQSAHLFKPGVYYKKGEILLQINSDEHRANLRSQKSNLYNQIVLLLPDLKLDYPDAYPNWEQYVQAFDIEKSVPPLPKAVSEKEKMFVAGRNILTAYYNVKNLEERLTKYVIYAPYSGILTETLVDKGTLVRAGQKLGEFINPDVFELEVAVNTAYSDLLQLGKQVVLHNVERSKSWKGKVARVNPKVDQASQTIQVYIGVSGAGLKEGMYLEADLQTRNEQNTYEVSRKLLVDNNKLFVFKDSILQMQEIEPVYYKENTVVVRGLVDGTEILSKSVPGAYAGMRVQKFK